MAVATAAPTPASVAGGAGSGSLSLKSSAHFSSSPSTVGGSGSFSSGTSGSAYSPFAAAESLKNSLNLQNRRNLVLLTIVGLAVAWVGLLLLMGGGAGVKATSSAAAAHTHTMPVLRTDGSPGHTGAGSGGAAGGAPTSEDVLVQLSSRVVQQLLSDKQWIQQLARKVAEELLRGTAAGASAAAGGSPASSSSAFSSSSHTAAGDPRMRLLVAVQEAVLGGLLSSPGSIGPGDGVSGEEMSAAAAGSLAALGQPALD